LVVQINERSRVMLLSDGVTWRSRTWRLEQLVDGAWCTHSTWRSADMLRWLIKGKAIGPVDASATAVLDGLPPRVDRALAAQPPIRKRASTAVQVPEATTTAPAPREVPAAKAPAPKRSVTKAGKLSYAMKRELEIQQRARELESYAFWRRKLR
jgi:hypothetical protein